MKILIMNIFIVNASNAQENHSGAIGPPLYCAATAPSNRRSSTYSRMPARHPNVAQSLMLTREAILRPFRPIFKAHGLTGQQWRVVRTLQDSPDGLSSNEIASACQILAPSMSQILAGMEKNGLVVRARSDQDQRRQTITLTPAGMELANKLTPLVERQYVLMERVVGKALFKETLDALARLRAALETDIPNVMDEQPAKTPRRPAR